MKACLSVGLVHVAVGLAIAYLFVDSSALPFLPSMEDHVCARLRTLQPRLSLDADRHLN